MSAYGNYLDPDVAYLLGLIVMRGTLHESGGSRELVIEFPYKSLKVEGYDQAVSLKLGVNEIRDRVQEMVETPISVNESGASVIFAIRFLQRSIAWRNLIFLLEGRSSYLEFEVPSAIFSAPVEIQREFVRGVADVGGFIRQANRDQIGRRRVFLEVNHRNWVLPIQLCLLLQQSLGVPVHGIQWGHPNVRTPGAESANWRKEHQIRIYAADFLPVGFHLDYKNEILRRFAREDEQEHKADAHGRYCSPFTSRRVRAKPAHPGESDPSLPDELRGHHYNAYWQVCKALGCDQRPIDAELEELRDDM